jgi:hypothetical protein
VVGQHHRKRGSPALNRLHLQYSRRSPDGSAAKPASNGSKHELGYLVEENLIL